MPIGLWRLFQSRHASELIEALNKHNDSLNRTNIQIVHNIANPTTVGVHAAYSSLKDQEKAAQENFSAGLPKIFRELDVTIQDSQFFTSDVTNDPDNTTMGKHEYVVYTGGQVKIGTVADQIAIAQKVTELVGPELLANGIRADHIRSLSGVPMNRIIWRMGFPTLDGVEDEITSLQSDGDNEVAAGIREWLSNMDTLVRGVFKVRRKFGSLG